MKKIMMIRVRGMTRIGISNIINEDNEVFNDAEDEECTDLATNDFIYD